MVSARETTYLENRITMRTIRSNFFNPRSPEHCDYLSDHILSWDNGKINNLEPFDPARHTDYEDLRDKIVLPGLVDIHVHLSQYRMRGLYRPALLPWLQECVFPEEQLSSDPLYARDLSNDFFKALFQAGTTTAVIYTAPFAEACETAFAAAESLGARAIIGMTLMDRNSPGGLMQTTDYALSRSIDLCERYHHRTALLDYIFTPRFAPTCSEDLMREIGRYAEQKSIRIQTHLSENKDEIAWVQELFGMPSYTAVYDKLGLLGSRTILAHCIHLDDTEISRLADYDCRIAHCPDSNFYLKSGEMDYQRLSDAGLKIALGSDVGAGTKLSMLYHAKMMNYRQSSLAIQPAELLYNLSLGSATALDMQDRIGSLDPGKEADLAIFDVFEGMQIGPDCLSRLCFFGDQFKVHETIIRGRSVHGADNPNQSA